MLNYFRVGLGGARGSVALFGRQAWWRGTSGTISPLFGLQNKIIDQKQYSILVTVVILSAFVPTLIAQKFFEPSRRTMEAWGRLYQRKVGKPSAPRACVAEAGQQRCVR